MNGIRFTYVKNVFLFHQNENGRKELCKWKKFCEWCSKRKTHAHRTHKYFIHFHWIGFMMRKSYDAKWEQNNMRQMSIYTHIYKKKEQKLSCCHNEKWKLSDARKSCTVHLPYASGICYCRNRNSATCERFISFYLWFGGVFEWNVLPKILITGSNKFQTKRFNVARSFVSGYELDKTNTNTYTRGSSRILTWMNTQNTQLQRIIRFVRSALMLSKSCRSSTVCTFNFAPNQFIM